MRFDEANASGIGPTQNKRCFSELLEHIPGVLGQLACKHGEGATFTFIVRRASRTG
jgi:hypothetical protein